MIRVLLVDDEQFIRQGLRMLINWEEYGYQVVAEAENGVDAIRILEEGGIDLVFVDIKMPGMTGLELLSYVRENISAQTRFVILTGYAEFDYARQAMQMRVIDYMLKPVQEKELVAILKRINRDCQRERKERQENYDFHITHILLGKFSDENLAQARRWLKRQETWKYVSFEFDGSQEGFARLDYRQRMEQQKALRQYLQSLLGNDVCHVVPLIEAKEGIFGTGLLLSPCLYEGTGMEEADYLKYLQKRASQHLQHQIQVYVGQAASLEQLSKSAASIQVARCLHGLAQEEGQVMDYEKFRYRKPSFSVREESVGRLLEAVKNNQKEAICQYADAVFTQIRDSDMNLEMVNASIYHILYRLMEMVQEFDDEANQQEILAYIGKESFNKLVLSGSAEEITGFFNDYAGYLAQVRSLESRNVLDKVDDYVQAHYQEKLSLKSLGEMFYVNNVYLGQLYKKRHGMAFRDYLNQIRLEKAQELLAGTDMRIYAIAEEVGFGKVEYFINKFVQMNAMTPNQYRICMRDKTRQE